MSLARWLLILAAILALAAPAASQTHAAPAHSSPATGVPAGAPAAPSTPGGAPAAAPAALAPSILTIGQMPSGDGRINLMARLVGADQRALGNQTIEFEILADFFGNRPVPIGSAVTMATGQAMFMYKPVGEGEKVRARFAGSSTNAAAAVEVQLAPDPSDAPQAQNGHTERALAPVWQATAWAAAVVSATIWFILAAVFVSVWRGLRAGPPDATA
jgi:hypothetical protein